ncbi:hypothetical protein [Methanolobus sp. WCC4]|uniref:hypothetical protein n=1 Tax=Methanolobus sp. WCC4 TaxID=3125784 RepID=UPI0030FC4B24
MTGQNDNNVPRNELTHLIRSGNEILGLLEDDSTANEHEYQKKRNMFISDYNKWYSRCLPIVRTMMPDRSVRFESLHHTTRRSGTNEYTYTIQDYIHGVYFNGRPKSYTDSIAAKRVREQISILKDAVPRTGDFSFEMEKFVKINPIHRQPSNAISKHAKLVDAEFNDEHYVLMKNEINSTFKRGSLFAAFVLSRELIRNLLLDMIRLRFPPSLPEYLYLYYDMQNNCHKEIRALIGVIDEKKDDFDLNPDALEHLIEMIDVFEPKTRPSSHSFLTVPTREHLEEYKIEEIVDLLIDIIDFMKKQ